MKDPLKRTKLQLIIIVLSFVNLLSMYSLTVTEFAWGIGNTVRLYLALYLMLIVSTILVITKVHLGNLLLSVISFAYSIILINPTGQYLFFNIKNLVLIPLLLLPFSVNISLMVLNIKYLTNHSRIYKFSNRMALVFALASPLYISIVHLDADYPDSIYADAKFLNNGGINIICKPGFGDTREFYITSPSKELSLIFKNRGVYDQGSWSISNLKVIKNFQFSTFKSLTIKEIHGIKLSNPVTWKAEDILGDVSFLNP